MAKKRPTAAETGEDQIPPEQSATHASESDAAANTSEELATLKEKLVRLEAEHAAIELSENAKVAKIVSDAQKALLESPLYKFVRSVLFVALLIGLLLWVGGAIYSGIQIASIHEQSERTLKKIDDVEKRVEKAEKEIQQMLDEKVAGVTKLAGDARDEIVKKRADALTGINDSKDDALEKINQTKDAATEKLDVKELPDLRRIKSDIAALEKAGGKVNLASIDHFIGWSFWCFFVFSILSLVLSILAFTGSRSRS